MSANETERRAVLTGPASAKTVNQQACQWDKHEPGQMILKALEGQHLVLNINLLNSKNLVERNLVLKGMIFQLLVFYSWNNESMDRLVDQQNSNRRLFW